MLTLKIIPPVNLNDNSGDLQNKWYESERSPGLSYLYLSSRLGHALSETAQQEE